MNAALVEGARTGTVTAFDQFVGLGTLRDAAGTEHTFHCTRITDGSRTIAVGTEVSYVLAPVGPGTWEAVEVSPQRG